MDPQTVANTLCKASLAAMEHLFGDAIHRLAAFGVFMGEVMAAVDGTRLITTPTFTDYDCLQVITR